MSNTESLQLFEDQPIRSAWDEEAEEWYFSIVDVVGVLTEQPDARYASMFISSIFSKILSLIVIVILLHHYCTFVSCLLPAPLSDKHA